MNSGENEPRFLKDSSKKLTYKETGVLSSEEFGLRNLIHLVKETFKFREDLGKPLLDIGYFANLLKIGSNLALAISTDSVGTKILVAEALGKYDTIGIDCVAMNVNDVVCVGAEPIAMVDYLAVEKANPSFINEIAKGLYEGAKIARICIPGGEVAQVGEILKGYFPGTGFDLVGTCVGLVEMDRIIIGEDISEGDVVVGFSSSGIHSNGFTLARKALLEKGGLSFETFVDELGRTVGEELLEPTRIYVPLVLKILKRGLRVKALIHITGDGFLNLSRVKKEVGYRIDFLPEPPPIFELIQKTGDISDEEMFRVFNMGIGFCIVVGEEDAEGVLKVSREEGIETHILGRVFEDMERKIEILPKKLLGVKGDFFKVS